MSRVRTKCALLAGLLACGVVAIAQAPSQAQVAAPEAKQVSGSKQNYSRPMLTSGQDRVDTLSENDIPTGDGGFFRDYEVRLQAGDNVAIDLKSNEFDPIVSLIKPDGTPMGDNDDSPEGTTDSLLFTRIKETGNYIIRVRSFGETGGGEFTLTVTRLVPID